MHTSSRLLAGASFMVLASSVAQAQSTVGSSVAAAAPQAGIQIGEVVVTARRRAESLQKVPIAVSVVSGLQAASQNLNDLQDITQEVPSVDFRAGASNKDRTVFIRGVGTITTSPGVEPSVSTVIDGVVQARPGQATLDLLDLDHIEVLRGPQGTLFGKNASAGVINIVTRNPTDAFKAYVDGSAYEGAEYRIKGGISGAIVPGKLDGLISAFTSQYRGNVNNVTVGNEVNGYRHTGGRGKLIWRPSDTLTLNLSADYTASKDTTPTGVFVSTNRVAYPTGVVSANPVLAAELAAEGVTPSADNRTTSANLNSSVHDKNGGVSLQADWDLPGEFKLTSISAFRGWRNLQYQDYDQLSRPVAGLVQGADTGQLEFRQYSEEVRLASPKGHFIDYVVGAYYLHAHDRETYQRVVTQVVPGSPNLVNSGVNHFGSDSDNFALFGEADVNFTEGFRAIAGYREIFDNLNFEANRVSTAAATGIRASLVPPLQGDHRETGYADRFGLQYDVTSLINVYATYSHGYKGPAYNVFFNIQPTDALALNPETSNSYEGGIKAQLFDRRLQANLAGFITDFANFQANFTDSVNGALVTRLINAGSVSTRGFEGDITARVAEPLTLTYDFAYDEAKVVNFACPPTAASSCQINNQVLPFAPRFKMHAEADLKIPLPTVADIGIEADYNYQSSTQFSLAETPDTIQPAYGIFNASVALLGKKGDWQVRGLVKNILDKSYSPFIAYGTLGGVVRFVPRDDHRYFGVDLRKEF